MKRKLALLLVAIMTISLFAGCGAKSNNTKKDDETKETLAALDTSLYVKLGDYKGLTVNVGVEEITDEYVDTYIKEYLLASFGETTELTADDTVQEGDNV